MLHLELSVINSNCLSCQSCKMKNLEKRLQYVSQKLSSFKNLDLLRNDCSDKIDKFKKLYFWNTPWRQFTFFVSLKINTNSFCLSKRTIFWNSLSEREGGKCTQLMTAAVTLAEDSPTPEPTNIAFKCLNVDFQNRVHRVSSRRRTIINMYSCRQSSR